VAAGDAKGRAGNEHARAFDLAGVDAVAQGDVGEAAGANVANGGESGAESKTGVFDAGDGFARDGNAEALVAI